MFSCQSLLLCTEKPIILNKLVYCIIVSSVINSEGCNSPQTGNTMNLINLISLNYLILIFVKRGSLIRDSKDFINN